MINLNMKSFRYKHVKPSIRKYIDIYLRCDICFGLKVHNKRRCKHGTLYCEDHQILEITDKCGICDESSDIVRKSLKNRCFMETKIKTYGFFKKASYIKLKHCCNDVKTEFDFYYSSYRKNISEYIYKMKECCYYHISDIDICGICEKDEINYNIKFDKCTKIYLRNRGFYTYIKVPILYKKIERAQTRLFYTKPNYEYKLLNICSSCRDYIYDKFMKIKYAPTIMHNETYYEPEHVNKLKRQSYYGKILVCSKKIWKDFETPIDKIYKSQIVRYRLNNITLYILSCKKIKNHRYKELSAI